MTLPPTQLEWVRLHIRALFDVEIDTVPIAYSAKGLRPWEGAVTWIENGKARIQLHPRLEKGSLFFGFYSRDEILAHELVHALRAHLNSPRYEEHLAYWTSPYAWRRLLGPLFERSWEAPVLIGAFLFPPLGALALMILSARLIYRQRRLARAYRRLGGGAAARKQLLFSSDTEIDSLLK